MSRRKTIFLWVMAVFYAVAGANHLLNPEPYIHIIPKGLPDPAWLNVLAGLAEIMLGVFLLNPSTRVLSAWGVIALLVAVFPANLYMALENISLQTGVAGEGPGLGAWLRLPLQIPLLLWAFWFTRENRDE